ncbi:hypothetical protein JCGZ_20289 [Jatropha curcas]|uniref:Uncharacterized protein n=1 Tax=Jatropha curcas TaxID=180498 RepID=A0A067JTL6_JATCU|nr:hypothetical protein JCGZ_20289 [Jatropha curcas]
MKFATDWLVAHFRALNARRPPSSLFFFLSSPPLFSSVRSAVPVSRHPTPARLTPPSPLHCKPDHFSSSFALFADKFSVIGSNLHAVPERIMAGKLGREPTSIEVFKYIHTKDHNLKTFIDRRAVSVNHISILSSIEAKIIKLQLHKEGYTWDAVPQEVRDFYWVEFQDKKKRRINICYGDSSIISWKLGREPTLIKVFTYTHTKDHDLNTFVDRRTVSVNEYYTTAREHLVSSQTDESEAESSIDEVALYLEAVGGEKKRKPEHSAEEFTELWARVDDQQRQIAELRAHVMLLSGQPGAGTSSSDSTPATKRNVSTSQQQPLPSPDPDAADDTLVTPPGTIAHPAGTPPGNSTLDRADDQPHGFDF